jgi:hypothetical protein
MLLQRFSPPGFISHTFPWVFNIHSFALTGLGHEWAFTIMG